MRRAFTILTLTVVALVVGAGNASAQWRRGGPVVNSWSVPSYNFGTTSGVRYYAPTTNGLWGNRAVNYATPSYYPAQNVYTPAPYNSGDSNFRYAPRYNSGFAPTYYPGNTGFYGNQSFSSPVLQFGSAIRSWVR